MNTTTINPVETRTEPSKSPTKRTRRLATAAACVVLALGIFGTASPAAAAGNGHACFTHKPSYSTAERPLWNVRVTMHYWDSNARDFVYAGKGYDRYTNSNGCAYYNLPNLVDHKDGLWYSGQAYNWSGRYVMFAVHDVSSSGAATRTFWGPTSSYVVPGTSTWRLDGFAGCWGITCP